MNRPRLAALLLLPLLAFGGPGTRAADRHSIAEEHFRLVVESKRQNGLGRALAEADRLVERFPNFLLAHLVRADLLHIRAGPTSPRNLSDSAAQARIEDLRVEAEARLRAHADHPPRDRVPRYVLQLGQAYRHIVLVDASRWRVFLYENDGSTLRLVADYYTSLGKRGIDKLREGDQKTPIGVFHVTSMIPGSKLPDLYGWGAFPISYPNEWDRLRGRTGYGIWLHGVPADTYARAPWASDGCIALANPDIAELGKYLEVGTTPVVISRGIDWVTPETMRREREGFLRQFEQWRTDWESRDTERFLSHYAAAFRTDRLDRVAFSAQKRRVNAAKSWIRIGVSDIAVLRNPGTDNMMVVTFHQDYRSSSYAQRSRKRQYWVEEQGRWKISYEGSVSAIPRTLLPESYPGG